MGSTPFQKIWSLLGKKLTYFIYPKSCYCILASQSYDFMVTGHCKMVMGMGKTNIMGPSIKDVGIFLAVFDTPLPHV